VRYGCLKPWASDPGIYSRVTITKQYRECEDDVLAILRDLLSKRVEYSLADGERFFDAEQNARLVSNAERYYRTMYYAENNSWNQRDQHMFETLQSVLAFRGPESKAIMGLSRNSIGLSFAQRFQQCCKNLFWCLPMQHLNDGYCNESYPFGAILTDSGRNNPLKKKQSQVD